MTAGGRRGWRLGVPRASRPGARRANRPGSGTRTSCPCPGAEGELTPAVGVCARQAGAPLGASAQGHFGGSAGSPGGRLRRGDPRLGMPAAETGWGLGSDPAWRWGRRRGARRMAGCKAGKEFLVNPSTEDPSGLIREGELGVERGATLEGSN